MLTEKKELTILSLGAGVQSSALALMASRGELNWKPDYAIFADTGAEPKTVYTWLSWLEKQLTFPVIRVEKGNLKDDIVSSIDNLGRVSAVPFFTKNLTTEKKGKLRRSCTTDYKILPINKKIRELLGVPKGRMVPQIRVQIKKNGNSLRHFLNRSKISIEQLLRYSELSRIIDNQLWVGESIFKNKIVTDDKFDITVDGHLLEKLLVYHGFMLGSQTNPDKSFYVKHLVKINNLMGISSDEAIRIKPNYLPWIENIYPLVKAKISRQGCIEWMEANNYPKPPRSACTFCPYHSNKEWLRIKNNPKEWEEIVKLDKKIRGGISLKYKEKANYQSELYLHPDCVPIEEVDLGQDDSQGELFDEECEGMCGI